MNHLLLASEGGYQEFELGGTEFFWLFFSAATAVLAIIVGFALMRGVLAADQGTAKMQEIAGAIQQGAAAYLAERPETGGKVGAVGFCAGGSLALWSATLSERIVASVRYLREMT